MRLVALGRLTTSVLIWAATIGSLAAQSVTFGQVSDPQVLQSWRTVSADEWLESHYALDWGVQEINRVVRGGKRLDFIVITGGLGLRNCDLQSPLELPAENMRPLRAALVPAVYVLPGEIDLPATKGIRGCSYSQFILALKQVLSPIEVHDLTTDAPTVAGIQVLGLDSASFGNDGGRLANENRASQLREIERLQMLASGRKSIIFASLPNLDDPVSLGKGKSAAASWHVDQAVTKAWNQLLESPNVLAVFAGHLHSQTRNVYARDYSWALNKPNPMLATKLSVAPPLTAFTSPNTGPLVRGFNLVTVSADGSVSLSTTWLPSVPALLDPPDKSDKLAEARAYEKEQHYDKAATAYQQGLSSKDAWVRAQSEAGFQRMVRLENESSWRDTIVAHYLFRWWKDIVLLFVVFLLVLLAVRIDLPRRCVWWMRRMMGAPTITISPPRKGNEGAPADEFTVQLILALERIQKTLAPLQSWRYIRISASKLVAPETLDELPDLKLSGVEVKALLQWILWVGNLLRRRIEIQVWGSASRTQVLAVQKLGFIEEIRWVAPGPGSAGDAIEAAQQLAYNIIGQELTR